jgi:hypothetical protein
MEFTKNIYIAGTRMGTSNSNKGIELASKKIRLKKRKARKVNGNKKG